MTDEIKDKLRMGVWLALSLLCYALALVVSQPQIEVILWKIGHVTIAAHLGYQIDRQCFGRIHPESSDTRRIARAILIAAAMLAVSTGL